jgi:hypothetical protein
LDNNWPKRIFIAALFDVTLRNIPSIRAVLFENETARPKFASKLQIKTLPAFLASWRLKNKPAAGFPAAGRARAP